MLFFSLFESEQLQFYSFDMLTFILSVKNASHSPLFLEQIKEYLLSF